MPQAKPQNRHIPMLHTRAAFQPATLNEEARTVELTWTTGAQVRRVDWWTEKEWVEELSLDPNHVRLERLNNGAPLLANHDASRLDNVIGVVEKAWIHGNEGRAMVRFSDRDDVKPILQDVKSGILRNISVGYKVNRFEEQQDRKDDLKIFRAVDWEPMELSLVTIPADAGSQVRGGNEERYLVTITHEVNAMTDKVEKEQTDQTRAADVPAESVKITPDHVPVDTQAERASAAKAERERIAQIRSFGQMARVDETVIADLVDRGIELSEAKEAMMKQWSKQVDAETSRSDVSVTTDARDKFIEQGVNAIRARAGVDKMDGGNELRGLRLTEVAKLCLERAGVPHRGMSEMEMVKRAFTQSESDFPILLENAMHKTLLAAYMRAALTWRRFCATGSVTDFRAHNRYRLGSFGNLDALNELGEFKNKTIPDGEKESITASTKGNVINVSRQVIINDDLGAFIGLSQMLGNAAARTIEADVYALLASNPTMSDGVALFHANHGNLAGSGAAPTIATIEAGRVAMASQTDVSGNDYLDLRPQIWVGGMANGGTAREINAQEYNDESQKNQRKPNIVRGLFGDVVDTPRIAGNEWYMFADPMDAPAVEVAFLNGEQEPFLDSMDGFNVDGGQWKVRLDYGVDAVDWRPAYKNPGA